MHLYSIYQSFLRLLKSRPRFSLRSLLLFFMACGSGVVVWLHWDAWVKFADIPVELCLRNFSADGKRIVGRKFEKDHWGNFVTWDIQTQTYVNQWDPPQNYDPKVVQGPLGPLLVTSRECSADPAELQIPLFQEKPGEELARALGKKVSFEFDDTPLDEALGFLFKLCKLKENTIRFNPNALNPETLQSLDHCTLKLKVTDMRLQDCLNWIGKLTGTYFITHATYIDLIFARDHDAAVREVLESSRYLDIRDMESGKMIVTVLCDKNFDSTYAQSLNSKYMAVIQHKSIGILDLFTGETIGTVPIPDSLWNSRSKESFKWVMAVSNRGDRLVLGDSEGRKYLLFDLKARTSSTLPSFGGDLKQLAFQQDGERIMALHYFSDTGTGELYCLDNLLARPAQFPWDNTLDWGVSFSENGERLYTYQFSGHLIDLNSLKQLAHFKFEDVSCGSGTFRGNRLFVQAFDSIQVCNAADGSILFQVPRLDSKTKENYTGFFIPTLPAPPVCSMDGKRFISGSGTDSRIQSVWRKMRPEEWWGLAWLPEFWLTTFFALTFGWSLYRDKRELHAPKLAH